MTVVAAEERFTGPGSRTRRNKLRTGQQLRQIREERGLRLRDVEEAGRRLAKERRRPAYMISAARLSQIESTGAVPSLYKLATLSEAYEVSYLELLRLYGVEVQE